MENPELSYGGLVVNFLERKSRTETKTYCYPVTEIHLITLNAEEQISFKVIDGIWKIIKNEKGNI